MALSKMSQAAAREATVKGYKVKTNFRKTEDEEMQSKKKALTQVILDSIKKLRK